MGKLSIYDLDCFLKDRDSISILEALRSQNLLSFENSPDLGAWLAAQRQHEACFVGSRLDDLGL